MYEKIRKESKAGRNKKMLERAGGERHRRKRIAGEMRSEKRGEREEEYGDEEKCQSRKRSCKRSRATRRRARREEEDVEEAGEGENRSGGSVKAKNCGAQEKKRKRRKRRKRKQEKRHPLYRKNCCIEKMIYCI